MSPQRVLIYLLRRDLRLADNPIFYEISRLAEQSQRPFTHVLPVYVYPAQQIEVSGFLSDSSKKSPYPEARSQVAGFWRCGPHRAKFVTESVWDLKKDLESKGSDLTIRVGMVGQVLQDLLKEFGQQDDSEVSAVWMTEEEGVEEKREERAARKATEQAGVDFKLWIDEKYLVDEYVCHHQSLVPTTDDTSSRDIPFDKPSDLPDVFTSYRKSVEPLREAPRRELPTPTNLPPIPSFIPPQPPPFTIPTTYPALESAVLKPLQDSPPLPNFSREPPTAENGHPFHGGSSQAHRRIQHLLATAGMTHYKDTRNGLLGLDYSTKLSAWLALGCITARQIHWQLIAFEDGTSSAYKGVEGYGKGENKGTAAVRFELLWRDYMRLCTRKFGPRLYRLEGFRNDSATYHWRTPGVKGSGDDINEVVERFQRGETGISLIDASQRELYHTGYTSNRARQNVASFLAKHLSVNWMIGAEWYEYCLVDYDVSSNWGNWQYVAGVGNDPRGEARVFNPVKQAHDYDPRGEYCKAWVEELKGLGTQGEEVLEVYQPWLVRDEGRRRELGLQGVRGVEKPLKRIDFRLGRNKGGGGGGGGGGGRYGGNSRGWAKDGWRGRGRGGRGGNAAGAQRGRAERGEKRGDMQAGENGY